MNDMIVNTYTLGDPSIKAIDIANTLSDQLKLVNEVLTDNACASIVKKSLNETRKLNYAVTDLRIDAYKDHVGVVCAMGTTANISRRVLSAIHYNRTDMIGEIIFVCQSPINAWYQHNHSKSKPQSANGNRATSKALTNLIDLLGDTINFPVIVLELVDDVTAIRAFHEKMPNSGKYMSEDYKIDWNILE